MPYWSSSRVGAVPQQGPEGQPSKTSKKRSERFGGRQQKGITMEDLKKQTALRLANEQHHRQERHGGDQRGYSGGSNRGVRGGRSANPHPHASSPSINHPGTNETFSSGGNGYGQQHHHHQRPVSRNEQPPYLHSPASASPYASTPSGSTIPSAASGSGGPLMPTNGNGNGRGSHHLNHEPAIVPRVDTRTSPTSTYDRSKNNSARVHPSSTPTMPSPVPLSRSNHSGPSSSSSSSGKEQRPEVYKASSFSRSSSSKSTDSATQSKQPNNKSKLPHGLTVQELKEMTRARLQAEAADGKSTKDKGNPSTTSATSPTSRNLQTPEPQQGVPTTVTALSSSSHTPVATGFYHQTPSPRHQHDAWSQDSRGPETWDNASVSTCASDAYLSTGGAGGDLPTAPPPPAHLQHHQGGGGGLDDFPNAAPFVRSRSYPVSSPGSAGLSNVAPSQINGATAIPSSYYAPHHQQQQHQDGGSQALPLHGVGGGYGATSNMHLQNRRRAQTLSPRVGLSYVHEDRPSVLGSTDAIPFPQTTSSLPLSQKPSLQPQQRHLPGQAQPGVAPSLRYGHSAPTGSSGLFGGGDMVGNSSVTDNRQRTSSTTSLPAISNTADEFGIEQTTSTSSRFASQFEASSIREDQPLNVPGLADVFRGSGFGTATTASSMAPPGLAMSGLSEGVGISTSSSGGGQGLYPAPIGDSRMRAATWSEPATSASDVMFSGLLCGDQLSDDLASILKLSGASEENKTPPSGSGGFDLLFSSPPPGL